MRASTAAGINNSLLHGIAAAGEFAGSAIWEEVSFPWHLWEICRWCYTGRGFFSLVFVGFPVALYRKRPLFPGICEEFADGAVWGRGLFPLAFVAFGTFGTGEGLLLYGICIRC